MDKKQVMENLVKKLEEETNRLKRVIKDLIERRNEAPTRNETRYDSTRAELQYSLNAYQLKLAELESTLSDLKVFLEGFNLKKCSKVEIGSFVQLENGLSLLILPFFGGETIKLDGKEINIITPKTPIYRVIKEKKEGDIVILPNGSKTKIEVVQ